MARIRFSHGNILPRVEAHRDAAPKLDDSFERILYVIYETTTSGRPENVLRLTLIAANE
jgi:hypothetical protein